MSLASALFSKTQQRVLGLLLGQPARRFTLSELIRLADAGTGAVQREVDRLSRAGIVTTTIESGRKHIQANSSSPIFSELRGIVEKTSGIAALLRDAIESSPAHVRFATLYGSVAKGTDTSLSDIDVLIVSDDLTEETAFMMFRDVEGRLGRRISPTIYTTGEFADRRRAQNPFLAKVLSGQHVVLAGSEDAVAS
jgi:predicted nucleotidyltransferase